MNDLIFTYLLSNYYLSPLAKIYQTISHNSITHHSHLLNQFSHRVNYTILNKARQKNGSGQTGKTNNYMFIY